MHSQGGIASPRTSAHICNSFIESPCGTHNAALLLALIKLIEQHESEDVKPVRPVELVEVNVVGAKTLQAAIDGCCDGGRV